MALHTYLNTFNIDTDYLMPEYKSFTKLFEIDVE